MVEYTDKFRKERGKILDEMEKYIAELDKMKEQGAENIDKERYLKCYSELAEGFFAIWRVNIRELAEYGADPKGIEKLWEKYQKRREEYEETKSLP